MRGLRFAIIAMILALSGGVWAGSGAPKEPPATRREDGTDPFRWLEDATAPEVGAWTRAQDAYARSWLGSRPSRPRLLDRLRALSRVERWGVPVSRAGRLFYTHATPDQDRERLCWREGEGLEHVLLDPDEWSAGAGGLGRWVPSWDGRKVVFARHPGGGDDAALYVIDVDTRRVSATDVIPGARYADPDWTRDGAGFYYEWANASGIELRHHRLGTDPRKDPRVFGPLADPRDALTSTLGPEGRFLFVSVAHGWNASDLYVRDLSQPVAPFRRMATGVGAAYHATAWRDWIYVHTDDGADRARVMRTRSDRPEREHWEELVPEDPGAQLVAVSLVGGDLALSYLRDAVSELRLVSVEGAPLRTVALPGAGTITDVSGQPEDDTAWFRYESFTAAPSVYAIAIADGGMRRWAGSHPPFDPRPYVVDRVRYPSRDGTEVPMFLVRREDARPDGDHPAWLTGYGGFSVPVTPSFRASAIAWLEAGGIFAVANLRGGGELGKAWHEAGRGANRGAVIDDFVAAGEYLAREGWTRPGRIAITGASNGGLVAAAAMTRRPDLWGAVVCASPLVDMLRYPLFGAGRTWVSEYGDPAIPEEAAVLRSWSPYQQIRRDTAWPPLLVLAGAKDDRVDPMHARKLVAAIQSTGSGHAPTLLRVDPESGHGGPGRVTGTTEASADTLAFLFEMLGVHP